MTTTIQVLAWVPNIGDHPGETARIYRVADDGELGELVVIQSASEGMRPALERAGWREWRERWTPDGWYYRYYIDAYQVTSS